MLLFSRIMQRFSNRMWLCISFAGWQLLACKDATPTSIRDITDASLVGEGGTGITPRLRRFRFPPGGNGKGPEDAWVEIVEFSEFTCAICQPVAAAIASIAQQHGDRIRVVFRHSPSRNPGSLLAAQAAVVAGREGRFWSLHDLLFATTGLTRKVIRDQVRRLGLNPDKVDRAMKERDVGSEIDADRALASRLGLTGSPHVFVNGRLISSPISLASIKRAVSGELVRGEALLSTGIPASDIHSLLMADAREAIPTRALSESAIKISDRVYDVPLDGAHRRGAASPLVHIAVFTDLECPFSARLTSLLNSFLAGQMDDVQLVFKHLPLAAHRRALAAARAVEAAGEQRRFWEMHDLILEDQGRLSDRDFDDNARRLGLDLVVFRGALESRRVRNRIDADRVLAARLGVVASPTMFLNGRRLTGRPSLDLLESLVENEKLKARKLLAHGVSRGLLYRALTGKGSSSE
jgi:protein-disulfide isomerase